MTAAYPCRDLACNALSHAFDSATHALIEIGPGQFAVTHRDLAS